VEISRKPRKTAQQAASGIQRDAAPGMPRNEGGDVDLIIRQREEDRVGMKEKILDVVTISSLFLFAQGIQAYQ